MRLPGSLAAAGCMPCQARRVSCPSSRPSARQMLLCLLAHPCFAPWRALPCCGLQGVQWYTYSPETSMAILGFGSSGAKLQVRGCGRAGSAGRPAGRAACTSASGMPFLAPTICNCQPSPCSTPPPAAQAIQFSKAGTLRLPLLDLTPPWWALVALQRVGVQGRGLGPARG